MKTKWTYSLRGLLFFIIIVAALTAWVGTRARHATQAQFLVNVIEQSGGFVSDSDPYHEGGPGEFFEDLLGRYFFTSYQR